MKMILNVDGGFKCELYLWSQSWKLNTSLVDRHFSHGEREHRNSQQSVPCTWQVAWVLGSQLSWCCR